MFGAETGNSKKRGVIPRSTEHLFHQIAENEDIAEVTIRCSFLEIYKENIRDLLQKSDEDMNRTAPLVPPSLKIRQSKEKGVYVQGLIEKYVYTPMDILDLIKEGERNRSVAYTKMNDISSRSHSLFTIHVHQALKDGSVRTGKLNLVDLAGSENVAKSQASGNTLSEAQKINKSLSALGNVIFALTDNAREHVPYRDSRLTYLLQDSLGGNTKTVLIVTASPHQSSYAETLSTLKFAKRAKEIKNAPTVNKQESVGQLKKVVGYLEDQLEEAESRNKEMQLILEVLGVERDEEGQFRVPKDLKASSMDNKEINALKVRDARSQRRIERLERKLEKSERQKQKESEYASQLKDLFHKQKQLAESLALRLRKRDEAIIFLTNELDEYTDFQRTIEEAVKSNPQLLAGLMHKRPSLTIDAESSKKYKEMTAHLSDDEENAGLDSPPESPSASDTSMTSSKYNAIRRSNSTDSSDGSRGPMNIPVKMSSSMTSLLNGVDYVNNENGVGNRIEEDGLTDEGRAALALRRQEEAREVAATKVAVGILEGGNVFKKYPYGGLLSKATKKSIFYDKKSGLLYYWDVGKQIKTTSKSMAVTSITDIYIGKKTPAFDKAAAKNAVEDKCFSVKDHERTLDFEAISQEQRDMWMYALYHLMMVKHRHKKNPGKEPVLHGELPAKNYLEPEPEGTIEELNRTTPLAPIVSGGSQQQLALLQKDLPDFNFDREKIKAQHAVMPGSRKELLQELAHVQEDSKEMLEKTFKLKDDPLALTTAPVDDDEEKKVVVEPVAVAEDENDEDYRIPADILGAESPAASPAVKGSKRPGSGPRSSPKTANGRRPASTGRKGPRKSGKKPSSEEKKTDSPFILPADKITPSSVDDDGVSETSDSHYSVTPGGPSNGVTPGGPEGDHVTPGGPDGDDKPVKAKAIYSFKAKSDLQLSFKKGQILTILSRKKKGWWDAQRGNEIGAIPYNYVKIIPE